MALLLSTLLLLTSCKEQTVPGGEITIRNDVLDKTFNTFRVHQITTSSGLGGYQKTLKPGEEVRLPFKNVRSFRITRKYSDHSNVYVVKCPPKMNERLMMKLIDIHSNRLSAGCRLAQKGRMGRGGKIVWE